MSRKARTAAIESRRKTVAANLLAGLSYRDIAAGIGVSAATVAGDVRVLMKQWRTENVSVIDDWLQLQIKRLDRAINAIWGEVQNGNLGAIDRLQRMIEQQGKLMGWNPAISLDLQTDGKPMSIEVVRVHLPAEEEAVGNE